MQKSVVANPRDRGKEDALVVVLLVSLWRLSQAFVPLLADILSAFRKL